MTTWGSKVPVSDDRVLAFRWAPENKMGKIVGVEFNRDTDARRLTIESGGVNYVVMDDHILAEQG